MAPTILAIMVTNGPRNWNTEKMRSTRTYQ